MKAPVTLFCLFTATASTHAATIVSTATATGAYTFAAPEDIAVVGWYQPDTYTDITIQLPISGFGLVPSGTIQLIDRLGPGSGPQDVIATTTVSFFGSSVVAFSGLTLPAGYYNIVVSNATGAYWETVDALAQYTVGPGIELLPPHTGTGHGPFPPADIQDVRAVGLSFNVTGNLIPEPSAVALIAAATAAHALRRRRGQPI